MKKVRLLAAIGASAVVLGIPLAYAAGLFPGLPVVGGSSYCTGFSSFQQTPTVPGVAQSPTVCNSTVPAGPAGLTGSELIPADTGLAGGAAPQTVSIPASLLLGGYTNRLIGGDMTTNLAQVSSTVKGVATLANLSPTAAVITADRWWIISPLAATTTTIDSTAATAVIPGFNNTKALRVARTSSGAAGQICVGQTLDKAASAPLIGQNAVFSFWLFNGAGQSATSGNFSVNVDYSSAGDTAGTQATLGFAGGNGSLFALGDTGLLSTGPTNMTRAIAGFSPGTTGTVAAGVATIQGSTTWTRYGVYAPIPVNVPTTTTAVTNVSVSICFTPTATSAITTDYIEINGMQLEAKPSTVTPNLPAGVISPTAFERRPAEVEAALEYYYWYYNYENQSLVSVVTSCANSSVTVTNCFLQFPVPMRIAPVLKYTAGFQAFTTTAYTTVGACTGLAADIAYAAVPATNGVYFACTAGTIPAAGTVNMLSTLGTSSATGIISASAEP